MHSSRSVRVPSAAPLSQPLFEQEVEDAIDAELYTKVNAHMRILTDQLRDELGNAPYYPIHQQIYAMRAIAEYKQYASNYYLWESSPNAPLPKLVSVALARLIDADEVSRRNKG